MSQRGWSNALVEIGEITRQILLNGRSTEAVSELLETRGVAAFTGGMGPLLGYWAIQGKWRVFADIIAMLALHHRHN